jgi:hypothetical protein
MRVALIDLFAHVLPGNPKASDWRLIKDVATRDGMQVVTLDGPIQLRPDAGRPQCFSKDVISHGRFVFTTKEHTFAFAVLLERRGWNQQWRYSSQKQLLNVRWNSCTNFPSRSGKPSAQACTTARFEPNAAPDTVWKCLCCCSVGTIGLNRAIRDLDGSGQ